MSLDIVETEQKHLNQRLHQLDRDFNELDKQMGNLDPTSPEYGNLLDQMCSNLSVRCEVLDAYNENLTLYRRPRGRITSLFSRFLGPLPTGMKSMKIDDEAEATMTTLPSYRTSAILMVIGVVAIIATMSRVLPMLFISPLSLVLGIFNGGDITTASSEHSSVVMFIATALVTFVIIGIIRSRRKTIILVRSAALDEELLFRSGAENWNAKQRIISCVAFGFCHVINIIYPLVTLLALSIMGAFTMLVYLREYRRSHDTVRATLASTKFHATYNAYVIGLLAVLLTFVFVAHFFI